MVMVKAWRRIIDFIFPKRCLACGKSGEIFCLACLNKIPKAPPMGPKIHPALDYRNENLKKALWLFKYGGYVSFAETLGEIIYDRVLEEMADLKIFAGDRKFVLVPIPLSSKKLKKRRFNQSELIAKRIYELDNGELFDFKNDALVKIRETESQMSIKQREKRLKNLAGAFAVKNSSEVRDKNVVIIDDIVTTGATISEAAKVLKEAGALGVIAFTVAH